MKIKAIKQGNYLHIEENLNLNDGEEIIIFINDNDLKINPISKKWEDFKEVIGAWKDDQEITEIFAHIDQERHQDFGREVNF
ncbi:hypothetical protein VKI21_00350 [Cyanobacterium aponinum UTEX 3222]|uniref:hypothetical protein n=1 Tax=Cyanobacterium aponinum TaxID=379064 RepID=UPI00308682A7|nr:hypothetical protein VKI21_00350 [Cyanobacterium aponinum UTEX 3222]